MHLLILLLALQEKPPAIATTKEAMQKVQLIVGDWRVTAMPRELKREPWTEKASWSFKIEKDLYTIRLAATDAVFWKEATLAFDLKDQVYALDAALAGGGERRYTGKLAEKERMLTLVETTDAWPRERAVFSLLRDNRFLIDIEVQSAKGKDWNTQAQLGCTKEGVPFVRGEGPKCIVTGGAGTIPVTYGGKTYYVCCTGCRAFFNDAPEKVIAEAKKAGWIRD
jgi:YHS domain-containing protein